MSSHFVDRIIKWNSQRYERVFNYELTKALFTEETSELIQAIKDSDDVETLDAIGDVLFVTIGALWKMGLEEHQIKMLFDTKRLASFTDFNNCKEIIVPIITQLIVSIPADEIDKLEAIKNMSSFIFSDMLGYIYHRGWENYIQDIINIICTSNETKEIPVQLINPSIKANIVKGDNYIAPTENLTLLLETINRERTNGTIH